jgi:cytochrome P450
MDMLPPGPRTPAFWQTLQFVRDPRGYSRRIIAEHGRNVRFLGLNGNGVAVSDPEIARRVFAADPEKFETPPVLAEIFGRASVLATFGAPHKRQRKLLNPRFHGNEVRALASRMEAVASLHSRKLEEKRKSGDVAVVNELAQALTLDVILETVFGASAQLDRAEGRAILVEAIAALSPLIVFSAIFRHALSPPWRRYTRARAAFDTWVDARVDERKRDPKRVSEGGGDDNGDDLLGMLMSARYEDGGAMSRDEIRDQVFALLIAGHETTAVAIAWGVYWSLREKEAAEKLRAELDALSPDAGPEALPRVPFLDAFMKETLRIEPIVTDVARICREPLDLGEFTVPKGELCVVNISALMSDESLYPQAHRFRPERFLERKYGPGEFPPFGGGHRRCLGAAFAEMELAIVLATLLRDWELALADDAPEKGVRRNITMGPERGVRVRVKARRSQRS